MDNKKTPRQKKTPTRQRRTKTVVKIPKKSKLKDKIPSSKLTRVIIVLLLIVIALLSVYIYLLKKEPQIPISSNTTSNTSVVFPPQTNQSVVPPSTNATVKSLKPRLVLIIDDVVYKSQIDKINKLPLKITPSFLPPILDGYDSSKNAKYTNFHMVHLPLEALNFSDKQDANRLYTYDSYETIYKKLVKFKEKFPDTIFYNGHTGSKFTSDYEAMDKLFRAMDELGLIYVESKTIADVASVEIAEKYGKKLLVRDVFLDHELDEEYIKERIVFAVQKAKENGQAIAIGHPNKITLNLLEQLSSWISQEVDVIYLNELYYAEN